MRKVLNTGICYFLLLYILSSCTKEYSYEGGNTPPPILIDTTQPPVISQYVCASCIGKETYIENRWSMRDDTLLRCGIIDTAIVNPERTGFTFFGPSACSQDTGIVMTILLDTLHLNRDITNYTFNRSAFYYYDNIGQTYIYMSRGLNPFTVTLESYNHQTKMAHGNFNGYAYGTNGGGASIRSGKFKVKLH